MKDALESVETILRQTQICCLIQKLLCIDCGRTLPIEAKKCHPCNNTTLQQRYCTTKSRVADYFETLRICELWPSTGPFQHCSVSDIAYRLACVKTDLKHQCVLASRCPLHLAVEELGSKVAHVKTAVRGLCLRCIKDEAYDGGQTCAHRL
jgi:ribosomal protein L40E